MASIDMPGLQGQADKTKEQMGEGLSDIQKMGDEFEGVKQQLEGMPEGLDADIAQMVQDVETEGRGEATQQIESVRQSVIDTAKSEAAQVQSDVQQKISDNTTARGKLDGIQGDHGFGRAAADRASQALDANNDLGNEILSQLEEAIQEVNSGVSDVLSKL